MDEFDFEQPDGFDPDDYEQLDEFHTEVSDYSLAGHIMGVTSDAEKITLLATHWALMRGLRDSLGSMAMVLERLGKGEGAEETAQMTAEQLNKYVALIDHVIPKEVTEES